MQKNTKQEFYTKEEQAKCIRKYSKILLQTNLIIPNLDESLSL